jgi:hypothetical protein
LYYNQIKLDFSPGSDGWSVSNKENNLATSTQIRDNELEFVSFNEYPNEDLYLFAPSKFLGNKLASYGCELNFNIRFEGQNRDRHYKLEVRFSGARVNLVYTYSKIVYPYICIF